MGLSELADLSCLYRLCLGLYNETVLTFKVSINWAEFVILVISTQDRHLPSYTKCRTNRLTDL